jgi:hypothetical protein
LFSAQLASANNVITKITKLVSWQLKRVNTPVAAPELGIEGGYLQNFEFLAIFGACRSRETPIGGSGVEKILKFDA